MKKRGCLVLEDGEVYNGFLFGAMPAFPKIQKKNPGKEIFQATPFGTGEIVFNTAMSGYHEILTDPSYTGQIVTMTYPHIGNYGCSDEWSEDGTGTGDRRKKIKTSGIVVRSLYGGPIPKGRESIDHFFTSQGVPGLTEVDTRRLTLRIRDKGAPKGMIVAVPEGSTNLGMKGIDACLQFLETVPSMEGRNLLDFVGTKERIEYQHNELPVAVLDCGIKRNIVEVLVKRGARVMVFPSDATPEAIVSVEPRGLLVSNGPGDPSVLARQIHLLDTLIGKIPIAGICLGHQLICLALGAKTYKMKFGHHGSNHPVRDLITGKVFVTSQNHGFAVDEKTLPDEVKVWCKNANDGSLEGVVSQRKKIQSVQFHPEAAPGPRDSYWIFDSFLGMMGVQKTPGSGSYA